MTDEEKRTYANMVRTAYRMLERTENRKELAQALYQYNARALVGGGGMMLPGDVICAVPGGIVSARGMAVPMSPGELSQLVDGGALDRLFRMDDLNAPDFDERIGRIMSKAGMQREYQDASRYYVNSGPGLQESVAVYDVPETGPGDPAHVSVERSGGEQKARTGVRDDLGTAFRQCTYEEFNPGGRALLNESRAVNPERENRGSAYDQLREGYLDGGENKVPESGEVKKPEDAVKDIPGYDKMSASEKLSAMKEATEKYSAYQAEMGEQAAARDASAEWTPMDGKGRLG